MLSSFGKFARAKRLDKNIRQTEFAAKIGESLSRVSQFEHRRTHINDAVVDKYIRALDLNGDEVCELRQHAQHSNSRLSAENKNLAHSPIHALLAQFGDQISDKTARQIRQLFVDELGPSIKALEYSSTRSKSRSKTRARAERPNLSLPRFVEISLRAEAERKKFSDPRHRLDVERLIERSGYLDERLDFDILERLPDYAEGAFACIVGHIDGHTILLEEENLRLALKGSVFRRHVILHEYAHHILHGDLLQTEAESYLPTQELARVSSDVVDANTDQIAQVVDNSVEVEAECFATMMLVPWTEFLKGTDTFYLAKDFGEQLSEVKRYARHFNNASVIDRFKQVLWERGERDHPIYKL